MQLQQGNSEDRLVQRFRDGSRPEALRARKRQLYRDLDVVAQRWGEAPSAPLPEPADEADRSANATSEYSRSDYSRDGFEEIDEEIGSDVVPACEIYA